MIPLVPRMSESEGGKGSEWDTSTDVPGVHSKGLRLFLKGETKQDKETVKEDVRLALVRTTLFLTQRK